MLFYFVFSFFRSTENLLHRLFVCIAGVADQLQTNFASDLRQILRSVFLMNVSPPIEEIEIDIGSKSKDSTSDLFEFRASENDVIHENDGGSNQSIYSAEEANPETDSVFEHATVQQSLPPLEHQERSASLETEIRITHRNNVERSQSLDDDTNERPVSLVVTTTNQIQCLERNGNRGGGGDDDSSNDNNNPQTLARVTANVNNVNNNNNPNVNNNQLNRTVDNSSTLAATTTTTIILRTNSRVNRNHSQSDQQQQPQAQPQQQQQQTLPAQQHVTETPPRWIPDEECSQCNIQLAIFISIKTKISIFNFCFIPFCFCCYFRYVMFTNIYNISSTPSLPMLWWCILWNMFKFTSAVTKIWT